MSEKLSNTPESESQSKKRLKIAAKVLSWVFLAGNTLAVPGYMYVYDEESPLKAADKIGMAYRGIFYAMSGLDSCSVDEFEQMQQRLIEEATSTREMPERLQEAQKNGATFVSPDDLRATEERLTEASGMEVKIDVVSDYSERNFGFKTVVTEEELAQMDAKELDASLKGFVGYSSLLPTNLIQKASIDTLTIKAQGRPVLGAKRLRAVGRYDRWDDDVQISLQALPTPRTFIHEVLGHAIHDTACHGLADFDRSLPKLNPDGYRYTDSAAESYSIETDLATNAGANGRTDKLEDVAETVTTLLTQGMKFDKTTIDTPTGQKAALIVNRIENIQPGSVDALMAVQDELTYLQQNPGAKTIAADVLPKTG